MNRFHGHFYFPGNKNQTNKKNYLYKLYKVAEKIVNPAFTFTAALDLASHYGNLLPCNTEPQNTVLFIDSVYY